MKIPFKTLEMGFKGHVVGCGIQGNRWLALDLSRGKRGKKWAVNWAVAGEIGDEEGQKEFARRLSSLTGSRHFWVSPREAGGLQVETARAIEIPEGGSKEARQGFFMTQVKSRFVDETIFVGGLRMKGVDVREGVAAKNCVHNVGGGAIRDYVRRDYDFWYSTMSIRRPHVASTSLALANAYYELYPEKQRLANLLRLVVLKGQSAYRAILMDDWRYVDEILLPRMEGDDSTAFVIEQRMEGWMDYFRRQHPELDGSRKIDPLVIMVRENSVSAYEHWDLWGEGAEDMIDMSEAVAEPILKNRDIAPISFGMALQGGC